MMKKSFSLFSLFFGVFLLYANTPSALQVREFTLPNGLTVWINEDHSQPKVYGAVVVKAGSKDCADTGIAHYFEHIMFKGTDKIGTLDYASEKVYLDSIAQKYDELALAKEQSQRDFIQKEINRLSIKASEFVIPNEFDRLISLYGGTGLNAFTSNDITAYHNTFSPQYLPQWAELNSERIMNPVFRMFQSELETVYEEKNMYDDIFVFPIIERLSERIFAPHPYIYSVIGSTENLKNPRLSEMNKFFEDYYVAGNMGLLLSGDIYAEEALPIIEQTFGRIRPGKAPERNYPQPDFFKGKEKFKVKAPIPVVKANGIVWQGVSDNHPDQIPLKIASRLMNNENGTGYLDKITKDREVMASFFMNMEMDDAGLIGAVVIPKLLFQSNKKARNKMLHEINRLKTGDFTEEEMGYAKTAIKKAWMEDLENIEWRTYTMMDVYAQGKSWTDYMALFEKIDSYTKEDIVHVANKYLTKDYLEVTKKTGRYSKEELKKPGFEPIVPMNKDARSEYAEKMEEIPALEACPKFVDFEKDLNIIPLSDLVTLYMTENPYNDIFTVNLSFKKGTNESRLIEPMTYYIQHLGTEQYTNQELQQEFQKMGSTLSFSSTPTSFNIEIVGFDSLLFDNFMLLYRVMAEIKADDEMLKHIVDNKKMEKYLYKDPSFLSYALLEKAIYGEKSSYLNTLSLKEVKKLKSEELINEYNDVLQVECDIHYSGQLPESRVLMVLRHTFKTSNITVPSNNPIYRELTTYEEPTVYFMNAPKATQSTIYLYSKGEVSPQRPERVAGNLFSAYFGSDMNSMVFQEIREFRSLAYGAGAWYVLSDNALRDKPGYFMGSLSTQADKTIEALQVMDSLVKDMPVKPERYIYAQQNIINQANNSYPNFRSLSQHVASWKRQGYTEDPNKTRIAIVEEMDMNNIVEFYEKNVRNHPIVYIVVGNEKNIDMKKLAEFGKIIKVKPDEVHR